MWTLYLHSLVICLACYQVDGSLPTNVLTPSCSPEAKVCHLPNVNIETRLSMAMYDEKTKQAKRVFAKSGGLFYKKSCSSPKLHHIYYHDVDSINALDGTFRYITTLNGGYPGPAFVVYENQEIVVNFTNNYIQEGTSIHFHGLGQRCTNWMDGVPGLNQCAFNQGVTFTYRFKVTPKGTHWYHSHYGFQRMDGLYGAFIVLPQNGSFPEPPYYQELLMVVQDFFPLDGDRMFTSLDQGLGGYLFEGCNQEGGRTADGAFTGPYQFYSALVNGRGRRYYDNGTAIEKVPMEVYRVRPNEKYKFRLLNAGTQFAFNISIDNHPITVVNTEIAPIEPVTADSIMVFVAERYEFYITTYKTVGNYWIRIETIEEGVKHFTLAVLRYEGAALKDPTSSPKNCTLKDKCRIFNCPYISRNDNKVCINVGEWTEQRGDFRNSTVDVNETLFFHDQKDIYNNDQASINGILFDPPTVPPSVLVRSSYDFNCTQNSTKRCTHQKVIKVNDTVQYVFIASQFNHPIHTHGYWYHILKVGYALPVTYDNLNLKRPVFKDTIALPSKGYAIIRFYANNTGWWFMHCHISVHLAQGMAMIQQVGEPNQMVAPPKTMHLCGNVKEKTSKSSKKLIAKLRKGKLKSFRIARKIDKCPAK